MPEDHFDGNFRGKLFVMISADGVICTLKRSKEKGKSNDNHKKKEMTRNGSFSTGGKSRVENNLQSRLSRVPAFMLVYAAFRIPKAIFRFRDLEGQQCFNSFFFGDVDRNSIEEMAIDVAKRNEETSRNSGAQPITLSANLVFRCSPEETNTCTSVR